MNIEIIPDGIDTDKKQILTQQHEDLAEYCQNCYVDAHLKLYDHIDDSDVGIQCHFIVKNEQLIVVFRGSNEFKDWFFNFIMTQTEYPKGSGIYIHSGFLTQILSIKSMFRRKLETHLSENQIEKIIFTGHSAGVLSVLSAYICLDLIENYESEIVTFGAPKPGNDKFKEIMEKKCKCTRIILDRDVVTRVPLLPNYCHVGNPIQIRENDVLERETSCWEHIHWLFLGIPKADFGIRDHLIWQYFGEIKKWVKKEN